MNNIKMERQQPKVSSVIIETPHQEDDEFLDLENQERKIIDNDDVSELASVDVTLYTAYTISKERFYRYRYLTLAIVVLTIVIIFMSRGAVGGVNAKNQDVDNSVDKAVGGGVGGTTSLGGSGGGGGGNTQIVKEIEEKPKKNSKSGKWL